MVTNPIAFGPFSFDPASSKLTRGGEFVALSGRGAALLARLLDADGAVVDRAGLLGAAWPGMIVEEANLTVQIAALRKALGSRPDGSEWIATVPRIGYRLVRQGGATEADAGQPTIAVLPFENLSSDPEQAYFADGVVEDIITALSRFKTFAVIARNSTLVYRGTAVDSREAARALGARYVLVGSVRRAGDEVRVGAQLIDGQSGAHLWAERFDGKAEDIFAFQDRITESVIGLVEPRIRRSEIERARRKRPQNLDAWGLYIRSLPIVYGWDVSNYADAIAMLERAIDLDPGFAPALALAAWAHEKRYDIIGDVSRRDEVAKIAMPLAVRALEAGPDDPNVLAIVGWMHLIFRDDVNRMSELVSRALEMNPNNVFVLNWSGQAAHRCGRYHDAIQHYERALRLSPGAPDNFWSQAGMAGAYFSLRDYEAAIKWATRSAETPNLWAQLVLAAAHGQLGHIEKARQMLASELTRTETIATQAVISASSVDVHERWIAGLRKGGMPER